jgi:methylated-DNA-protein-cysteine methyltransferase related protein
MSWEPIYKLVRKIPKGRVTTYGDLARASRIRGGARAVGHAMAATPRGQSIPWHRVVGANGRLLPREPYASLQRKLLESEGVGIANGRVTLEEFRWSPIRNRTPKKQKSPLKQSTKRS